jgi:hypothetical protein
VDGCCWCCCAPLKANGLLPCGSGDCVCCWFGLLPKSLPPLCWFSVGEAAPNGVFCCCWTRKRGLVRAAPGPQGTWGEGGREAREMSVARKRGKRERQTDGCCGASRLPAGIPRMRRCRRAALAANANPVCRAQRRWWLPPHGQAQCRRCQGHTRGRSTRAGAHIQWGARHSPCGLTMDATELPQART